MKKLIILTIIIKSSFSLMCAMSELDLLKAELKTLENAILSARTVLKAGIQNRINELKDSIAFIERDIRPQALDVGQRIAFQKELVDLRSQLATATPERRKTIHERIYFLEAQLKNSAIK